jgi:DeoR family transcriptional regulator, aga operon transcriptional repressor
VVGGKLVPGSLSMIGPEAERDLAQVSADWAFIGAAAIDIDGGFTSADPYEAQVKRAMIRAAQRTVIVADHTKFGARRFASFARADDIDHVITTVQCPPEVRSWLSAAGVHLTLCAPHSEGH